jgi:hypothetical protein
MNLIRRFNLQLRLGPPVAGRAEHDMKQIQPIVKIFAGLACVAGIAAAQTVGSFTVTGSLITPRQFHTATLLPTGKVLLAGGISAYSADAPGLSSAELYDPSTGTFSATGQMTVPRVSHTATLLPDGRVLVAGGYSGIAGGAFAGASATAELYNPDTGTFMPIGQMSAPRFWHSATLLNNGDVLIAGGYPAPPVSSAELYDPTTGAFTPTGRMTTPRAQETAVPLVDGSVLIVPGGDGADNNSAEIYDPDQQTFHAADWRSAGGAVGGSAVLLTSGKVLITLNISECDWVGTFADSYDPSSGEGTLVATAIGTCRPSGTLLSDGTVLIAAGWYVGAVAQVYDEFAGTFSRTGDPATDRHDHTATLLPDGSVLIAGGSHDDGTSCCAPIAAAELYQPPVVKPVARLLSLSGDGKGPGAIQHASTYAVVSDQNPAAAGEIVIVYCTGLIDGSAIPPQVAIGGRMAEVLWFGNTPGYPGLKQINVRVPEGLAAGSATSFRLNYLSRPSNEVTLAVR